MKLLSCALAALALQAAISPDPVAERPFFRYQRAIHVEAGATPQSCAPLDASVFAHSSASLADLRVAAGEAPPNLPYVITTSRSTLLPPDPARVLNLGLRGNHIAFDLQMPARSYTELNLNLAGQNFLATARLAGFQTLARAGAGKGIDQGTDLGSSTVFDLSGQHLSRSTLVQLQESSFPFLHVDLAVTPTPGSTFKPSPAMVQGATIPPNREAQTLYTPVAGTTYFEQRGRQSIATIELPARVPVERITFALAPESKTNFSRSVEITALRKPLPGSGPAPELRDDRDGRDGGDERAPPPETLFGEISRVHLTEAGQQIREESLSIPATLGTNAVEAATVEIKIENGDDRPLALASATLAMRQRSLCFETPPAAPAPGTPLTLLYGDEALKQPVYDFARLYNPAASNGRASLEGEQPNPLFRPRPSDRSDERRSLTERHPELLWLALLTVIGVLCVVAFRSSKHIHHP